MNWFITVGQLHSFLLVGYFGVSPKYRVIFTSHPIPRVQNRRVFSVLERSKASLVLAHRLHSAFVKCGPGKRQHHT
jgi:hypothetical protein